jgi:proteasome accessory factor B
VTDAPTRVERVLNLLALMLDTLVPRTREEYVREIAGYPAQPEANRRAFERDKEILRGMGVPITMENIGDGTEVGYRVRPDDYCLPDLDLSTDETAALRVAVSAISLGDPTGGQGALMKLGGGVGDHTSAPIASLPFAPALATLFEAFRNRAVVKFPYRGETRELEPWGLSSKRGHWYVVGFDRVRGATRAFRADRIDGDVEVGPGNEFSVSDDFRADDHIEDRAWMLGDAPPVTVRLAVDTDHVEGVLGTLGAEASLEPEPAPNGDAVVEVTVNNRGAFRSFVLSFLEHAEIIDPPEMRAEIVEWLEAVAAGPTKRVKPAKRVKR